jgi:hypothetical protein
LGVEAASRCTYCDARGTFTFQRTQAWKVLRTLLMLSRDRIVAAELNDQFSLIHEMSRALSKRVTVLPNFPSPSPGCSNRVTGAVTQLSEGIDRQPAVKH